MPELSILMPCYNDGHVLPGTVKALNDVVTHNSLNVEVLIIDDESKDDTVEVGKRLLDEYPALHIRLLARKRLRPGFGGVVRYGMAYATGRFCVLVTADGTEPLELLPQFLAKLRAGAQLVQCTRYQRTEDVAHVPLRFRVYQAIYRRLVRLLLGISISDTTYGFRGFDRVFIQALGTSSNRFNICPEMTLKAVLSGGRVEYISGRVREFGEAGGLKFRLPNEILGYAHVLVRAVLHRAGVLRWF